MKNAIGRGVFCWELSERVTKRYGLFGLSSTGNNEINCCEDGLLHSVDLIRLANKRVKITARVVANGTSAHVGDYYVYDPETRQRIKPSTPAKGSEFVLGIGSFRIIGTQADYFGKVLFGTQPSDSRDMFWSDPRTLYQLHDQTVEIFVEKSTEPELPLTTLVWNPDASVTIIDSDDGGSAFQLNKTRPCTANRFSAWNPRGRPPDFPRDFDSPYRP